MILFDVLAVGIAIGGIYALIAMGISVIFGAMHVLYIAYGDAMVLGAVLSSFLIELGISPPVTIPIIIIISFLLGAAIYKFLISRIMERAILIQIVFTIGIAFALESLMAIIFGTGETSIALPLGGVAVPLGVATTTGSVVELLIYVIGCFLAIRWILDRTRLGRSVKAITENRRGSLFVGIDNEKVYLIIFALGSAIAGGAGIFLAGVTTLTPFSGIHYLFLATVVIVMAGMGNVTGALYSGFILGISEAAVGYYFPLLKIPAMFVLFILFLALKPEGLFGAKVRVKV